MKSGLPLPKWLHDWFFQLDLRSKITAALLAAALAMGAMVTLLAYLLARHQVTEQTVVLLESRARLEQQDIELRLSGTLALAESIANNTVTANALADSRGRELYLDPLLRHQNLSIPGASLTVVDYRGRNAASTTPTPLPDHGEQAAFKAMLLTGKAAMENIAPGSPDAALLVALPIHYRLTGNIEGAVMLHIPLQPLLGTAKWAESRRLADQAGQLLISQGSAPDAFEIVATLHLPEPLAGRSLQLVLARDRAAAFHILDILLAVFLGVGLLVVGGVVAFARVGARHITAPLGELAAAAEEIAASGRPVARLPVRRADEFGRLSAAFNTMVERLQQSYTHLEEQVSERTRDFEESQQEAERAGNLLREAVQNIAVGFTIYDDEDRLVRCNEAYLRLYESSRDLIVPGASFAEIVRRGAERGQYAEAVGRIDEWVAERVALHQSANGTPIEQRLGDGRWLLIIEHRTPSGYIVGNRIDITEQKRAAEALSVRQAYQRATLDNLPFQFWLKDADTRFLAVNQVFAEACGRHSPDELVGLTDFDLWPPALAEQYQADDREVMASRQVKTIETALGEGADKRWIEIYKKPVITADGTLLGTVGFARDISERRLAEERIRDRTEQLNAIFSLSPDGFVSFDRDLRVKYANPAFLRMTALEEAEIIGLSEAEFSARLERECLPAAAFPGVAALRARLATHGEIGDGRRQLIELAGAGKRVLEVGARLSEAETVKQILYFRDVTHETEVDRLKSEFLSTAAHELRTPMACIYGFSELMLAGEFPAEEQREFLGAIFRQSELMVAIINELLDLARIEARRGKDFNVVRLEVGELLRQSVANFKVPAGRQPPEQSAPAGERWIRADRNKMLQAVGNVLSNAYKYSPDGGAIELHLIDIPGEADTPARIGIHIVDHGIGMGAEQLARVCERFYRADASGKIPGTGLGMSIVKEIIELHGGEVRLDSAPGHGTAVTLLLPAA